MQPTFARAQLGGLVPPKIASPNLVSGGSGAALRPLVAFYSKLPKGEATAASGGLKKYFVGRNATAKPLLALIVGLWTIGYTIDYQMHLKHHKNHPH
ncbi:uncharacterized protein SCHCODRAFT_02614072 [Schizophyllum commune H4-8]|uniref:uncharacterized protein n=1 Tax=Schizophyllum commune (strain H4-8 / FGSC 9210) TaxID=578458 RepID=UPI00215F8BAD|nr:uncharacterized protein SCHCODRAFT_02614072 [Schizophyllum commune H4-8]KAI5896113.1 hypothetical protein SCHCODRAFT_02614072 [Schizophyllum commune H4-8]